MTYARIAAKTVLSVLALLFLIVVAATPSLIKAGNDTLGWKLGAFKESGLITWSLIEQQCSDMKPPHSAMQAGVIIGILSVAVGAGLCLGEHFTSNAMLGKAGACFEALQLVGVITLISATLALFTTDYDCKTREGSVKLSKVADLAYGFYLACVVLVFIIANMVVGCCVKGGNGGQNLNSPHHYNQYQDGPKQEMVSGQHSI